MGTGWIRAGPHGGSHEATFEGTREARGWHAAMQERSAAILGRVGLPKRNYGYEKRQKELNRQRKQEEKRQRKRDRAEEQPEESPPAEAPSMPRIQPD